MNIMWRGYFTIQLRQINDLLQALQKCSTALLLNNILKLSAQPAYFKHFPSVVNYRFMLAKNAIRFLLILLKQHDLLVDSKISNDVGYFL